MYTVSTLRPLECALSCTVYNMHSSLKRLMKLRFGAGFTKPGFLNFSVYQS